MLRPELLPLGAAGLCLGLERGCLRLLRRGQHRVDLRPQVGHLLHPLLGGLAFGLGQPGSGGLVADLVGDIDLVPGSHSIDQLKHTTGYVPGLEEGVQALDSIGAPKIRKLPPPVDAPSTTGQAAEAAAAGAR